MLLSSGFNFVCRFASRGSFTISCYNSSQWIYFFEILWLFKICQIVEFKRMKFVKIEISIYD